MRESALIGIFLLYIRKVILTFLIYKSFANRSTELFLRKVRAANKLTERIAILNFVLI